MVRHLKHRPEPTDLDSSLLGEFGMFHLKATWKVEHVLTFSVPDEDEFKGATHLGGSTGAMNDWVFEPAEKR